MSKPTKTGLPSRKNLVTSFLLSLILIGSTISSALLFGLTISPQEAWAALPVAPTQTSPPNAQVTTDTTPTLNWNDVSASPAVTSYHVIVDNDPGQAFVSPFVFEATVTGSPPAFPA